MELRTAEVVAEQQLFRFLEQRWLWSSGKVVWTLPLEAIVKFREDVDTLRGRYGPVCRVFCVTKDREHEVFFVGYGQEDKAVLLADELNAALQAARIPDQQPG